MRDYMRIAVFALFFLVFSFPYITAQTTYTSVQDGPWTEASTWDQGSGSPGGSDIAIVNGHEVTISGFNSVSEVTIQASGNIIVNGGLIVGSELSTEGTGGTLTVNNFSSVPTYTFNAPIDILGTGAVTGTNFNVSASVTVTLGAVSLSVSSSSISGILLFDNVAGDKNINGPINLIGGTISFSAAETLAGSGARIVSSGSSQISGTAIGTVTLANTLTVSDGTLTVGGVSLSVAGATSVSGTLEFNSASGTKSFQNVTVNAGGTWNNTSTESFTVSGNIVNNNTWNGCSDGTSCEYTLTSSNGTISGPGAIAIPDVIIGGGASYTNVGTLTVSDRLTGAGAFISGVNSSFTYSGNNSAGTNFDITTFTASATGNTVTYSGSTDQQVRATSDADNNYYNLVINTSAIGNDATMAAPITVDNLLTLTTGNIVMGNNNLTIPSTASISGGGASSYIQDSGTGMFVRGITAIGAVSVPIGGTNYSPITVDLTSATVGGSASLEFGVTDAAHPQRDRDNTGDAVPGDDDGTAATDYLDVYWTVGGTDITNPVYNATYIYDASDFSQTIESNMVATLYRNLPGEATLDWYVNGTVNPSTNEVSFEEADGFGDLYAMDNTNERLPIVLLSFTALPTTETVKLKWVTASEENNEFFTIERSLDAKTFEPILFVDGAGNSQTQRTYNATDIQPVLGRAYYRLKQTDFNGQFEYSETIGVVFEGQNKFSFGINNNPVMAGNPLSLWHTFTNANMEPPLISIRDIQGNVVSQSVIKSTDNKEVEIQEVAHLSSGVYLLSVHYLGKSQVQKIIVR